MRAVEARRHSKSYGDVEALREVDLSLEAGEFFGLFGPNGAGKTTMLRAATYFFLRGIEAKWRGSEFGE